MSVSLSTAASHTHTRREKYGGNIGAPFGKCVRFLAFLGFAGTSLIFLDSEKFNFQGLGEE